VVQIGKDPRMVVTALMMARELGDSHTEKRLREIVENNFQPQFFGAENDRFGYWFGLDEPWPRGQLNAMLMMAESGEPGAWWRVFNQPLTGVHAEPTLRGVDYPHLGVRRARNDMHRRVLEVTTSAATPSRRGTPTTVTLDQLPDPANISVSLDGRDHPHWRRTGQNHVQLDLDVDDHQLLIRF
jgi:hypothetical protein